MAAPTQRASDAADAFVAEILDRYEQSEEEREARKQLFQQRTEIIARAVDLIGPVQSDRSACCAAIWDGLDEIGLQAGYDSLSDYRKTSISKRAARRVASHLRAAGDIAKSEDLDPMAQLAFPDKAVDAAIRFYSALAYGQVKGRGTRHEPLKTLAAKLAYRLLCSFTSSQPTTTKSSAFCRLAALLSGEPDADRTYICRKVKRGMGGDHPPSP